ncbi:MAG: type III-A CRISPR-associated protein Cas10/Csm1 [Nitrospirae bacterium]|nr:type III-A CRISPR-associated protein Cas10/Csm1 [Nitrospirota bacterium]
MSDFDEREYQTVILAALLHDVGKLLHRGNKNPRYNFKHEKASAKFIEYFKHKLINDPLYDIELVKILIACHDKDITRSAVLSEPYLQGSADDYKKRVWKMIRIVRIADSYSCSEREIGKLDRERTLPLESVFSYAALCNTRRLGGRYRLNPFKPMTAFPEQIATLEDSDINDFIDQFEQNIACRKDFSLFGSFDDVLNTWLNILHEFMWSVPSDTRYKHDISDISLFDHLRSTAAIAACLYKRHLAALDSGNNLDSQNEFVLIGGDFSGIQNYIFDITNRGSGGASKRLRARSFFIYLFTEAAIHKILHVLKLPLVCNVFSAGGKFLILAPNIDGTERAIADAKSQIEKEIHETYFAQFAFLMSWIPINRFRAGLGIKQFFKTAAVMFHALESEKVCKSRHVLYRDGCWNNEGFRATKLYESYKGNEDCPVCGKGPSTHEEDKDDEGRVVKSCFLCFRDKIFLGQKIPKCNYIAFAKGPVTPDEEERGRKIVLFHDRRDGDESKESYYVELLEGHVYNQDYYLVYNVGHANSQASVAITRQVPLEKYYANYVLLDKNDRVETFERIAELSRWERDAVKYGSDLLGVLKADVDNLGLIFNKGFEIRSAAEEGLPASDRKTVSRFLTLSRMLELFFSGWMKEVMSDGRRDKLVEELSGIEGIDKERFIKYLESAQIDFKNIYTVYSGGDDLILFGPWETVILFSIYLNQQFRKYTCNNDDITLSAGLSFIKPKQPISWGIRKADELLKVSKLKKDRLSFFGTTIRWNLLTKLINFFLFVNDKMVDDNSRINSAFVNRLLSYHRLSKLFVDEGRIEGLKYVSLLNYDLGRNIFKKDTENMQFKVIEAYNIFQGLINENINEQSLMYNLKVPIYWVLYRNRRG